jgi:hypothetical protein
MGDATPGKDRPGVLTATQEHLLLAVWAQEALQDLRLNWEPDYEFGMLSGGKFGWFAAWRKGSDGEPMTAESPHGLRMLVRADACAERDAREGTAP